MDVRVPLFDMASELASVRPEVESAITRVLDSGTFIGGPHVEQLEHALATALRVKFAIGTSSGTDALLSLLMALGVQRGDEVVTTPFTFFATAGAIARLGARPVFADIEHDTLTLDARAAESACSDRTRAVIIVNLFGCPAAVPNVAVPVLEDAAQSIGSGPLRGSAAALSFFPTKTLGAAGDAGAVITNDEILADRIALLRTHGARPKYHHVVLGGNFRLDALQAAILTAKLPRLTAWTAARRAIARRYRELFAAARVPPELQVLSDREHHSYNQLTIRTPRRDALRSSLATAGIGTEVYYPNPLHLQPCFEDLGYGAGSFPEAERACSAVLSLPIYPTLTPAAQQYVVDQIGAFFAS